jgi:hypothetical protein
MSEKGEIKTDSDILPSQREYERQSASSIYEQERIRYEQQQAVKAGNLMSAEFAHKLFEHLHQKLISDLYRKSRGKAEHQSEFAGATELIKEAARENRVTHSCMFIHSTSTLELDLVSKELKLPRSVTFKEAYNWIQSHPELTVPLFRLNSYEVRRNDLTVSLTTTPWGAFNTTFDDAIHLRVDIHVDRPKPTSKACCNSIHLTWLTFGAIIVSIVCMNVYVSNVITNMATL